MTTGFFGDTTLLGNVVEALVKHEETEILEQRVHMDE
jgi:hypothetical protein